MFSQLNGNVVNIEYCEKGNEKWFHLLWLLLFAVLFNAFIVVVLSPCKTKLLTTMNAFYKL